MKGLAVIPGTAKSLHVRSDIPDPDAAEGRALVRVVETGVCGTDLEINDGLYGRAPEGFDYLVLGHENLGVVDDAPAGASVAEGDLVVSTVRRPCPERCAPCASDQSDMCVTGHYLERGIGGLHGFMSERYSEEPRYLVRVPPSLRHVAVLLEPLSIVEKGLEQAFRMQERTAWQPRVAVVLGAGPVGLLAAACLRLREIDTFVLGRDHSGTPRDAFMGELGIRYISTHETPLEELPKRIGRADLVFEATGAASVILPAIQLLGPDGIAVLASVTGGEKHVDLDVATWNRQIVLGNQLILGTVNAGKRHFEQGVRDFEALEKRHPGWLGRMITRRVPFTDLEGLLKRIPNDVKTVLQFS